MRIVFSLLASLAMVSIFLSSCNDVGSFGADLNDEDLFEASFSENISLTSATRPGDSVLIYDGLTIFNAQFPVGNYDDPVTGNHRADLYFQVDIPFNEVGQLSDFSGATEVDSIVLRVAYDTIQEFYGSLSNTLNFQLYALNDFLDDDIDYYSNFSPQINPELLGSISDLDPDLDSSVMSIEPITGDTIDTLRLRPHMHFELDRAFGTSLITQDSVVLGDRQLFLADNPGFVLRSEMPSETLLYFLVATGFSGLHVYYTVDDKLEKAEFAISNLGLVVGNTYIHDFQNSPAQQIIEGQTDSLILVQGMGSLEGVLDFGDFSVLDNSIIANAELFMAVDIDLPVTDHGSTLTQEQLDVLDYDPISRLSLYDDADGEVIADLERGLINTDIVYDGRIRADTIMNSWVYRIIVTNYVQDLVNGDASSTLRLRSITENFEANRSVLFSENSSRPPRLEVVYSPLN